MPGKTSSRITAVTANGPIVASLRRRRNRARTWFIVFVALIPLGCIGPFSLFNFAPAGAQTPLVIAGLLLPFVGLGGTLLMLGDRSRYKRSLAAAEVAEGLSLRFIEKPEAAAYAKLPLLNTFRNADGQVGAFNLLEGEINGHRLTILDFAFAVGFGKAKTVYDQTVFLLDDAIRGVPDFIVYPRSWRDRLAKVLGDPSLEVPGHSAFNQQFALRGDADAVGFFNAEVVQRCLAEKDITLEARQGLLVACRFNKRAAPADFPERISWMTHLASALRAAVKPSA